MSVYSASRIPEKHESSMYQVCIPILYVVNSKGMLSCEESKKSAHCTVGAAMYRIRFEKKHSDSRPFPKASLKKIFEKY